MGEKALFHVTHAKAGSSWLHKVLGRTFGKGRCFKRFGRDVSQYEWRPGVIYPAIFLAYPKFKQLEGIEKGNCFFVMRDIRDTLVSLYFSMRYTHTEKGYPNITAFRKKMAGISDAEGIAYVFANRSKRLANLQKTWLDSGEEVVRYEDLITDALAEFRRLFDRLEVEYSDRKLSRAVERSSFKNTFGRDLGVKDDKSHGRQGSPGDWKNYITPELELSVEEFMSDVLRMGGYKV